MTTYTISVGGARALGGNRMRMRASLAPQSGQSVIGWPRCFSIRFRIRSARGFFLGTVAGSTLRERRAAGGDYIKELTNLPNRSPPAALPGAAVEANTKAA